MPTFHYKAVTEAGETLEGEMDAPSRSAVIERLHDQGHVPVRADELKGPVRGAWLTRDLFAGRRVPRKALALATRELATLLQAGLTLERSLEILKSIAEQPALGEMLARVLERVRGGTSLADAMASEERTFPRYYVSMVRAGETGGSLEQVLARLADFMEKTQEMAESVRSALIYPAFLLTLAGVSVIVLLTVVIPEFRPLFEDAGESLPLATQLLVGFGELFRAYWWVLLAVIALLVLLARRAMANPAHRQRWDRAALRLPLFGALLAKIEVARFSRTLGTLLRNGVALLPALAIVKDTLSNRVMAQAVEDVALRVKEGQGLATPLTAAGVFPALAVNLVRVGEETGELESMLDKIAEIYDREIQRSLDRLLAMLVPALTIGMGLLIAAIIFSILTAILSANSLAF
ncbi:MAG: type II secretion system F family protein [Alphaproteobacteria bacterium]